MKIDNKLIVFIFFMFVSLHAFSQVVVFNFTWINTDKPLLGVLNQKLSVNSIISSKQTLIHTGLRDIRNSKIQIRKKEYEENKYDGSLKVPLATNLLTNNLLLGAPLVTPTSFPFFITLAKIEYFTRVLAINDYIAIKIALERNNRIRNANTQELYSLNLEMITKLKKTNKHAHKTAAFVIVTSLLSNVAAMPTSDLDEILTLGL